MVRLGNQEPTFKSIRDTYHHTDAQDCIEFFRDGGSSFYPCQEYEIHLFLARTEDVRVAYKTICVAKPRQNGKSYGARHYVVWMAAVYGKKCLFSAHHGNTVRKMFKAIVDMFESDPELAQMLKPNNQGIYRAQGSEGIYLTNGGIIEFSTRTSSGGRGQTYDVIVIDEAQELTDEELEALKPTTIASESGDPQMILLGTPPGPKCMGTVFRRYHDIAHSSEPGGIVWLEWAATEVGDPRDVDRWYECNPALGYRIREDVMADAADTMAPDSFARENLGWWSDVVTRVDRPISKAKWQACEVDTPPDTGTPSYGVKFSNDGSTVTLSVQVDGFVECLYHEDMGKGIGWLVEWLAERWRACSAIVIDGKSGSQNLHDRLIAAGVSEKAILRPSVNDVIAACSAFKSAIDEGTLTHCADEFTDGNVCGCAKRRLGNGGGWAFAPVKDFEPSVPESLALSMWGALNAKRRPGRKLRIG